MRHPCTGSKRVWFVVRGCNAAGPGPPTPRLCVCPTERQQPTAAACLSACLPGHQGRNHVCHRQTDRQRVADRQRECRHKATQHATRVTPCSHTQAAHVPHKWPDGDPVHRKNTRQPDSKNRANRHSTDGTVAEAQGFRMSGCHAYRCLQRHTLHVCYLPGAGESPAVPATH